MAKGEVTRKARDAVCPACGGKGGKHTQFGCSYLNDEWVRTAGRPRPRKRGAR